MVAKGLVVRALRAGAAAVLIVTLAACQAADPGDDRGGDLSGDPSGDTGALEHENVLIDLWADGTAAFGIFVPNERSLTDEQRRSGERPAPLYTREGGERLARNPLYDFLFLNLEGRYDVGAVAAIAEGLEEGLRSPDAVGRKTLLVRIPPIERAGEAVTRTRVREILAAGADGVVLPHVRSPEEARMAVSFFTDAGADVWSPRWLWGWGRSPSGSDSRPRRPRSSPFISSSPAGPEAAGTARRAAPARP